MSDNRNDNRISDLIYPAMVILGLPAIAGAVWLLSGGTVPMESLLVMAGAYVMAVSWSAMSILNARSATTTALAIPQTQSAAMVTVESMRVMQSWPALDLVQSIAPQSSPQSIEVTAAVGICPRGFKEGDKITVQRDGTLSRPICRTAISALNPAFEARADSDNGADSQVSCLCPIAMRHLTFSISREREAVLN